MQKNVTLLSDNREGRKEEQGGGGWRKKKKRTEQAEERKQVMEADKLLQLSNTPSVQTLIRERA